MGAIHTIARFSLPSFKLLFSSCGWGFFSKESVLQILWVAAALVSHTVLHDRRLPLLRSSPPGARWAPSRGRRRCWAAATPVTVPVKGHCQSPWRPHSCGLSLGDHQALWVWSDLCFQWERGGQSDGGRACMIRCFTCYRTWYVYKTGTDPTSY